MKKNIAALSILLASSACSQNAGTAPGHSTSELDAVGSDSISVVKCLGISKKGHNDCGSVDGSHDCSGKSPADFDPNEWAYVPEGPLCERMGGTEWVKGGALQRKEKPASQFVDAAANAEPLTVVKCLGISKKGHNGCGSVDGSHDCSGKSPKDLDTNEWVYVPEGPLCEKWGGEKWVKDGTLVTKEKPRKDFIDS